MGWGDKAALKEPVFQNIVLSSFNVTFSHNSFCLHIELYLVQSRQHVSSSVLRAVILLLQWGYSFSHSQTVNCHLTWLLILGLKSKFPCGQCNCKYVPLPRSTYSNTAPDRSVYPKKRRITFCNRLLTWTVVYILLPDINKLTTLSLFKYMWSKNKYTCNY